MATKKLTITLQDSQLDSIRRLVADGRTDSVSGFVRRAVDVALQDIAGWGAMLAAALEETGGSINEQERAWADEALAPTKRQRGGKAA